MKSLKDRLTDRKTISRGDLAVCSRAREIALDRMVFLKILNPALAVDSEVRARFEREARAVSRLDHPNLVRLYEFGDDPDEGLYMMLEWIEGDTLARRLSTGKTLSEGALFELAKQLLAGVSALHSVGIIHRDIKPENILIRKDGTHKISDFSLAALRDAPKLTHHQAIVGTPAYMSPEQAAGRRPDERSDIFSIGVILYEAATGGNPFAADDMLETMRRIREVEPSLQVPTIESLPSNIHALIEDCLRKEVKERPQNANEALASIDPDSAKFASRTTGKRRNIGFLISGAFAIVIALFLVLHFRTPAPRETAESLTKSFDPQKSVPEAAESQEMKTALSPEGDTLTSVSPLIKETTRGETSPAELVALSAHDTVEIFLSVEPWAHIYFEGNRLGTTPLAEPLRLPTGSQKLTFRNPAYPQIDLDILIPQVDSRIDINLAKHVTLLKVNVQPWGDLYIDAEHAGVTPLLEPLFVSPGKHSLRISHPTLPPLEQDFSAEPGDTISFMVDLENSTLAVRRARETSY